MNIYKIVLTGGPCAGKTEVIEDIAKKLDKEGYHVIKIPETATELIPNGMPPDENREHTLIFQQRILLTQKIKEENAEACAQSLISNCPSVLKNKKGIIILYDRGIMDNRAYLSYNDYHNLLKRNNFNELEALDNYDFAIDLISLATTKPELYALNGIRYENPEEAAKRDQITSSAWLLHRNLITVTPKDTIKEKINIVFSHIIDFIENKQKVQTVALEVDKEKSDFSCYNDDNSRRIKITSFNIKFPNNTKFVLDKRKSKENVAYVIKKSPNDVPIKETWHIDHDTYTGLSRLNLLEQFKEEDILYFIDNGIIFNIVEDSLGTRLYTTKDNIPHIPKNIVLKKTLTK